MGHNIMIPNQEPGCLAGIGSKPLEDFLVEFRASITSRSHVNDDDAFHKDSQRLPICEAKLLQWSDTQISTSKDTNSTMTSLRIFMTLLAKERIPFRKNTMRNRSNIRLTNRNFLNEHNVRLVSIKQKTDSTPKALETSNIHRINRTSVGMKKGLQVPGLLQCPHHQARI